jgi:DNA (cytosine-5)-methyltransferase 1
MAAYYNEIDPEKAAWIRELIKANVVAPGDVDERDIKIVQPEDLRGFKQCHFFAGIAVWSYALRLAGWPDERPCWTGSCPCPSFSSAGKGEGFDDPRHLWPDWYGLIRECRPGTVFGEQVDAAIRHGWLDLVCGNMEAEKYAIAAAVLGAHSAGAPHIRQRLYFCAHTTSPRCEEARQHGSGLPLLSARSEQHGGIGQRSESNGAGSLPRREASAALGHRDTTDSTGGSSDMRDTKERGFAMHGSASGNARHAALTNEAGSGDNAIGTRLEGQLGHERIWRGPGWLDPVAARSATEAGATRGFWADCDWWYGRDGKYRPIEPGLFPLAHGATNRVLKLRGYGDAINAEVAKAFIESYAGVNV